MRLLRNLDRGFTAAELLIVLAMGAIVIGGAVVGFGTLVRVQPRVSSIVELDIGSSRYAAFFGASGSKVSVNTAPNYGHSALAEEMRELFHNDVLSATAVYCLARDYDKPNTFHPTAIAYNVATDAVLDTSLAFLTHIQVRAGVASSLFRTDRNYSAAPNATIFILGYSSTAGELKVNATYDIDVVAYRASGSNLVIYNQTGDATTVAAGFYCSVKRFTNTTAPQYYDIYIPGSPSGKGDGFTPLFVTFERSIRRAYAETTSVDRFKKAAERPFHFIWWPDPAARNLAPISSGSIVPDDPRLVYNHQGGRTAFMFTVPMFPAL